MLLFLNQTNYMIEDVKKVEQKTLLNLIMLDTKDPTKTDKGTKALSDIIGVPQPTIWNYVRCQLLSRS